MGMVRIGEVTAGHAALSRRARRGGCCAVVLALAILTQNVAAHAETMRQAMFAAYHSNPRLESERARLRAIDEDVARANSGYLPQVNGNFDAGQTRVTTTPGQLSDGAVRPWGYSLSVSQPVFRGFRTENGVAEAEAGVRAGRASLRYVEQNVLLDTVTAYSDVVRDHAIIRVRENNVAVLSRELQAAEARRAQREVTRTDVAQTQARRAKAISALDVAKGNLRASIANYERIVGTPPSGLVEPQVPFDLLPRSLDEARQAAMVDAPIIVSSLYRELGARHSVDRIRGELLPEVRIEASYGSRNEASSLIEKQDAASITGRVSIPLFNGGETHARVRQAKHTHVSRLQDVEQARLDALGDVGTAWAKNVSVRSQVKADQVQLEANRLALEGVRAEEKVGQRTIIDVLNAEQELLEAQVQLIVTRRDMVVAGYTLLHAIGSLNAETLRLADPVYDAEAHYEEVRRKWFGISITHANGRRVTFEAVDNERENAIK